MSDENTEQEEELEVIDRMNSYLMQPTLDLNEEVLKQIEKDNEYMPASSKVFGYMGGSLDIGVIYLKTANASPEEKARTLVNETAKTFLAEGGGALAGIAAAPFTGGVGGLIVQIAVSAAIDTALDHLNFDFYQASGIYRIEEGTIYRTWINSQGSVSPIKESYNYSTHDFTRGDGTDYQHFKYDAAGNVRVIGIVKNGHSIEVDFLTGNYKINEIYSGNISDTYIDPGARAILTNMQDSYDAAVQNVIPGFSLKDNMPTLKSLGENTGTFTTNSGSVFYSKNLTIDTKNIYGGQTLRYKDIAIFENPNGNKILEINRADSYRGIEYAADGKKTFAYTDPSVTNGYRIVKFNSLNDPSLSYSQKQMILQFMSESIDQLKEGFHDVLASNPSFINEYLDKVPPDLLPMLQGVIQDSLENEPRTSVYEITDHTTITSVNPLIVYQKQSLPSAFSHLSNADLADIAVNASDENSDLRAGAFWSLFERIKENGVVRQDAAGNTVSVLPDGYYIKAVSGLPSDKSINLVMHQSGANVGVVTTYANSFQHQVLEINNSDNNTNSVQVEITTSDPAINKAFSGGTITLKYPETFIFSGVGGYVGELIGQQLADNTFQSVLYSSALKTLGQHTGTILDFLANSNETLDSIFGGLLGSHTSGAVAQYLPSLYEGLLKNLTNGMAGALGSALISEFTEALEIDGIGGEIVNTVGSQVTIQFAHEAFDVVFHGLDEGLFDGKFFQDGFEFKILDLQKLAGSFIGSRLAGEVIEPESEIAAIFGSIASSFAATVGFYVGAGKALGVAIEIAFTSFVGGATSGTALGATAGTSILPGIGTIIGAFIGTIAGTFLGNLFGGDEPHPSSFSYMRYDYDTGLYEHGATHTVDGGPEKISIDMVNALIKGVNDIVAATGGSLRHSSTPPAMDIGWKEGKFYVNIVDGRDYKFGSAADAIEFAALHTLKNFDLVGGHAILMRAWHNSDAQTLQEWKEDIEVAEAFQLYLTNPTGVLALMMNQPESPAAQSWATILKRAAELELHLPHERDIDGGWSELLHARGNIDPSMIPDIEGNSIVLTDPVTGEQRVLHHVIGPGYEIVRIEGTDGNDIIQVNIDGPSITHVDAGAGDDTIEGSPERDIILGGDGNDTINGNAGDDWINGGTGNDTIHGNGGLDLIYGGDDNDTLYGDEQEDAIYGGMGDDFLYGIGGDDELFGGDGNDVLDGGGSIDILRGEAGNDTLYGYTGDTLIGGSGDDTYKLLNKSNKILISRGDGHDTVFFETATASILTFDTSISVNELWFEASGKDLIIKVLGENQSITVKGVFDTANPSKLYIQWAGQLEIGGNEGVHNSSSYLWKEAHWNEKNVRLGVWAGPAGTYNYLSDADLISRKTKLESMASQGTIPSWVSNPYNSANAWRNLHAEDYKYFGTKSGDGVVLHKGGEYSGDMIFGSSGNDTVTVPLTGEYSSYEYVYGDSGNDVLHGGRGSDTIVGGLGDDRLYGEHDEDTLYGGHGNDAIYAGAGNDIVFGGAGNDNIYGQQNDDTLYGGDGDDNIIDNHGSNTLYGEGGNDTLISESTSDSVLDGGAGNDSLTGHDGNDRLLGGEGNDRLNGRGGHDIVRGENGNDTLIYVLSENAGARDVYDGGAGSDKIILYFTAAEFARKDVQRDLLRMREMIAVQNTYALYALTAFALSVSNVEAMEIRVDDVVTNLAYRQKNGTAAADILTGTGLHDLMKGNDGADAINGGNGNDYIEGGAGNDILNGGNDYDDIAGGDGDDTIMGGNGDDNIKGGTGNDTLSGDANNDVISGDEGNDIISGGTGDDVLNGGTGNDTITGGDGNDVLYGEAGDDILQGNAGNDTLDGGTGNDVLNGGIGNDILKGGIGDDEYIYLRSDGHDTIIDSAGVNDSIRFSAGIARTEITFSFLNTSDLKLTFVSSPNNSITIQNPDLVNGGALSIEKLVFNDNSEMNLYSLFSAKAQDDYVLAKNNTALTIDILSNDNGYNGLTLSTLSTANGAHGTVSKNANGSVVYTPASGFAGEDSFTYTVKDKLGHTETATVFVTVLPAGIVGTSSGETLNGTNGNDRLYGLGGDDIINPGKGADKAYGGAGNDKLYANGGDVLEGGTGNDTYYQSDDNNRITINRGDGHDVIYGSAGLNRIAFADDIGANELWFQKSGMDLVIKVLGENQSVTVKDLFSSDYRQYGSIQEYIQMSGGKIELIGNNGGYHKIGTTIFPESYLGYDAYMNQWAAEGNHWTMPQEAENYLTDAQLLARNQFLANTTLTGSVNSPNLNSPFAYGFLNTADHSKAFLAPNGVGSNHATDHIAGTKGADTIVVRGGHDYVYGYLGNDKITGSATIVSHDKLYGDSGNDIIKGGAGDDLIVGGLGNDTLYGQAGTDILIGGADRDTFVFDQATLGSVDVIKDFSLSEKDKILLSDVLSDYDPLTDVITDFIQITNSGENSILKIDADGGGNNFVQIATLIGVTGLIDEQALVNSGNLVVV